MTNMLKDFVMKDRDKLIQMTQDYLSEKISHHEIKEYVWDIMDDWKKLPDEIKAKSYVKGENAFWAIIWEIITGADEEHWKDNCPQRVLPVLVECLKDMTELPSGYDAKRPD